MYFTVQSDQRLLFVFHVFKVIKRTQDEKSCVHVKSMNSIIVRRLNHKAIASKSISSNEKKITEFEKHTFSVY